MKKLLLLITVLMLFVGLKAQDSTYIYADRGMIRIDNLESVPVFMTPNQISYRLRGSNFILKDGLTRQEYNIGAFAYIFDEDTTGFASNDAVESYLNGFISNYVNRDGSTDAEMSIMYEHHEIHAGSHYNYCDFALSEASGDTIVFVLTTANTTKWVHLTFETGASEGATIELYEGASGITGGTTVTPRNNNRNSSNTSGVTLVKDPTAITSFGIRASGFLAGGGRTAGFITRGREFVLKQNETYILKITSLAVSNDIGWCAEWYEHTDKN